MGFASALLALTLVAVPQEKERDDVDRYILGEMERRRIPGLAMAVARRGRLVTARAYGMANLETGTPLETDSVFELASLTKPITATAVMMLVEEGAVDLDASIRAYVQEVPEAWEPIRIRHLLTHTSGLPEQVIPQLDGAQLMDVSTEMLLAFITEQELLFAPGADAQYSDPGYFLLGMVIERVSGRTYAEFLQKRIFDPCGMSSSRVLDQWAIIPKRVAGYSLRDDRLLNARRDFQVELPSFFGVMSTVEDLLRWENALFDERLVKLPTLEEMWTPATLADGRSVDIYGGDYGYGWMLMKHERWRTVEHGGFSGTHMLCLRDKELTIVVLTNLDLRSGTQPHLIARGIADWVLSGGDSGR